MHVVDLFFETHNIYKTSNRAKIYFLNNSFFNAFSFALKTCATKSGLLWTSLFFLNFCFISIQLGLHVIVIRIFHFPYTWTNAIASIYLIRISLGQPIKEEGKIVLRPIFTHLFSPILTLSIILWYNFKRISNFLLRNNQALKSPT